MPTLKKDVLQWRPKTLPISRYEKGNTRNEALLILNPHFLTHREFQDMRKAILEVKLF